MAHLLALAALAAHSLASSSSLSRRQSSSDDPSLCRLAAQPDVYLSEGFGDTTGFVSSTGTLRASMIFIDFPDAEANDTTQDLSSMFLPGAANWYSSASRGILDLEVDNPAPGTFWRMPAVSTSYGYARGLTASAHEHYIRDALSAVDPGLSFAGVEVLYIVPTTAAGAITFSPTYQSAITAPDGTSIAKTVTFGQDVPLTFGYMTLNHETGHAMGLPDLYPFDGPDVTRWTGGFDIMSLISGIAPDYGAWHQWKLGWLTDEGVACFAQDSKGTRTFTLSPLEVSGDQGSKAVVIPTNSTTAVVAEVRAAQGVDSAVCKEGVLIYAVYTDIATGEGPIRVFDSQPGSGGCAGDELNDAPYGDGDVFEESGVRIAVSGEGSGGGWSVRVTKG